MEEPSCTCFPVYSVPSVVIMKDSSAGRYGLSGARTGEFWKELRESNQAGCALLNFQNWG